MKIITQFYKPNENKPGYLSFDRMATNKEIYDQIISVLQQVEIGTGVNKGNAYGYAEWTNYNIELPKADPFPYKKGDLIVSPTSGNCEGSLILILARDNDSNHYVPVFSAKYFISMDELLIITKALTEAIENGFDL